jgi:5-methylcytosine-specific restriction protein A
VPIFILTWNPIKYEIDDDEYAERVEGSPSGIDDIGDWSIGRRGGDIVNGDIAILLRQHDKRGVVAAGTFTGELYTAAHWAGSKQTANYAVIEWSIWLPIDDRLKVETLKKRVPGVVWDRLQGSGTRMRANDAEAFDEVWSKHLSRLGKQTFSSPDDLAPADTYAEGAVSRVEVNRYERDPEARKRAIAIHGTNCIICKFDFGKVYGRKGQGYIHVHHLRDLSTLGKGYVVDPKKDLVPVCPNCHSMLHRQRPAISPGVLRRQLGTKGRRVGA